MDLNLTKKYNAFSFTFLHVYSAYPKVNCVISALDLHISYHKILKAATYLNRPNVLFLATNDDASLPQSDETCMPGKMKSHGEEKKTIKSVIEFRCWFDSSCCFNCIMSNTDNSW